MSVTVRLWSDAELADIKSGKDKFLATVLMNASTFSEKEILAYPYHLLRSYLCEWYDEPEPIKIYATDERNLLKFIDVEYTKRPDEISQIITQFRPVKF